jgi:hypothetical protein
MLAGCGGSSERFTSVQVEAVRAACIGADLLRYAE